MVLLYLIHYTFVKLRQNYLKIHEPIKKDQLKVLIELNRTFYFDFYQITLVAFCIAAKNLRSFLSTKIILFLLTLIILKYCNFINTKQKV